MKNKVLIFISGLLAGLTIGVLFSVAIKELIGQFKELHISLNKIDVEQSQLSQRLDSIKGKLVPDTKKPPVANTPDNSKVLAQNSYKSQPSQGVVKSQSQNNSSNSSSNELSDDSDVVVMTNQLIVVTSVSVENKDTTKTNKKIRQMDSTIAALSDVSESKEPQEYRIEFWKSPLNYKGYKMSRGKIIVYGIYPAGGIIFIRKDKDNYYLVNGASTYRLEYTDDYKPLEEITDKTALKN